MPLLDLQAQYRAAPRRDPLPPSRGSATASGSSSGPEVDALERELAASSSVATRSRVSSGTDALLAAMMALGIGPGDDVITHARSRSSRPPAASPARRHAAARRHRSRDATTSIPTRVRARDDAADPRDHSRSPVRALRRHGSDPGRRARGRRAGDRGCRAGDRRDAITGGRPASMGAIGCFSFFPEQEPRRVRRRRARSRPTTRRSRTRSGCCAITAPSRNISTSASAGTSGSTRCRPRCCGSSCRTWSAWTAMRRANAARYDDAVRRAGLTERVTLPVAVAAAARHIFNQYVVRVPERDRVRGGPRPSAASAPRSTIPCPFHLQECFASLGLSRGAISRTPKRRRDETLALPIYGELTADQQALVVPPSPRAERSEGCRLQAQVGSKPWVRRPQCPSLLSRFYPCASARPRSGRVWRRWRGRPSGRATRCPPAWIKAG